LQYILLLGDVGGRTNLEEKRLKGDHQRKKIDEEEFVNKKNYGSRRKGSRV